MRLIDADAGLKHLEYVDGYAIDIIKDTPTIEAGERREP